MKRTRIALAAIALGICGVNSAAAHDSVGISLSFGAPAYYYEPPVYYAPRPVYYGQPAVYIPATPVYYESYGPRTYYRHDGRRFHHEHHGWKRHHDHDDD